MAKAYRCLSGAMDGAVDAGLIARSPCTIKGAGTERHAEMEIATPEQVADLAAAVGPRWEALVFAAAYTGLRWGELAGCVGVTWTSSASSSPSRASSVR